MNGLDENQVYETIQKIIEDYSDYIRELMKASDQIMDLKDRLSHYEKMEETLKKSLILAQQSCADIVDNAEKKASNIITEAQINAKQIIESIPNDEIIFAPDLNLGGYVAKHFPNKTFHIWQGYCITHHRVVKDDVVKAKQAHPDALLLAHPECRQEVIDMADFVGSTSKIIEYAKNDPHDKFIIATEMGILHKLKNDSPHKTFYLLTPKFICPNMKKTKLESVYNALKFDRYQIELDEDIINRARKSLEAMLSV